MTDNTSDIAGDVGGGVEITCILYEGTVTSQSDVFGGSGTIVDSPAVTLGSKCDKNDYVELYTDTSNTYANTNGMPVVKKAADAGTSLIGQIISEPTWVTIPESTQSTWSTTLSGEYYRTATVEVLAGITSIHKLTVTQDGSNTITEGQAADLKYDISLETWKTVSSGGAGVIPLHYVAAGTNGDTLTILGGFTALGVMVA